MRRVALATCEELPDGDEDALLLSSALHDAGVEARWEVWSDARVDWGSYDLVVVRSTWDYAERYDEFLAWIERLPRVLNPPHVLRWSTDKRYLLELADAGAPVVPTAVLAPGRRLDPPGGRVVVKPAVSAGGRHAAAYEPEHAQAAREHVERLHAAGRTVIVQPYLEAIDRQGETGVVHLGGRYSHGFRKGPLLRAGAEPATGLFLEEEIQAREPSPAERWAAERSLASLPFPAGELLYARIDLAPGPGGEPLVLEVELAEPSLYLELGEGSAERLAAAIAAQLLN